MTPAPSVRVSKVQESARPAKAQWTSAGSYKDESDIWRGGVALGSYGTAVLRLFTVMGDCRGWGRYQGRIYQGRGGKRMVVVVLYAPDAQHDEGSTRGDYSQRLGDRALASGKGLTVDKWKPGSVPPKPTAEQVKHPKRLLWADLSMHLRHYPKTVPYLSRTYLTSRCSRPCWIVSDGACR